MICVIATIEVLPGRREDFLEKFRALVPQVRAEAGCLEYAPMIDLPGALPSQEPARENVVTVVEKWADVEALEAHLMAPHMAEFRAATAGLRTAVRLQILQPA